MKISINDNKPVLSIQQEFNDAFPFLKLEFFSKSHYPGKGTAKNYLSGNGFLIGNYRRSRSDSSLTITPAMTVSDLEESFRNLYNFEVQVFRKSGRVWLETTVTDSWTLEE